VIVWYLLAALAAHRAARAITADSISDGFRNRLELWAYTERRHPDGSLRSNRGREWLNGLLTCPHCCGAWLSWIAVLWLWVFAGIGTWWSVPLAMWAVAGAQSFLASAQGERDASAHLAEQRELREKAAHARGQ
jgi:Protein of unknown function (DUF1360)